MYPFALQYFSYLNKLLLFVQACTDAGGHCVTDIDGYYVELIACLIIGFTWLCLRSEKVRKLQDLKEEDWKCPATQ